MKSTTKQGKRFQRKLYPCVRLISVFLIIILTLSCFSGCKKTLTSVPADKNEQETNKNASVFSENNNEAAVGYTQEDSLNPFFMTTDLNHDLISLVFEPLFYIDDSFCAVNGIGVNYKQEGTKLTVTLDSNAAFSDGIQCSSADVIYSFNAAKSSKYYKNELSMISTASAAGADTVIFTLSSNCKNAVDSLSFPIVKTSTAQDEKSVPLGTGLYSFNTSGEFYKLEYNIYCRKPTPNIKTIALNEIPKSSTMLHSLELGKIMAYFDDMSSGSYSQASALSTKTNLPNLVFLGMNSTSYGLNSASFRQAVYYSVNRQSITKNSFKNYAVDAYTPFHPAWHILESSDYDTSELALDYSKAQSLLKDNGFKGQTNLQLIVFSGNNFKVAAAKEIKESLANIGINITISELTWEDYKEALNTGAYDLYIGEVKLPLNMDLSSLFGSSSVVYGVNESDTTLNAYSEFEKGNISINAFMQSFLQNMPFVPLCFRMGALIYSSKIAPGADCDINNAYKNIHEWTLAN